jgi:diacylglycerol kinase (ATP)
VDGEEIRGPIILAVISNVRLYAGVARIAPRAQVDDGLLDVCTFQGEGKLAAAQHLAWILGGDHLDDALLDYRQAREVRVIAEPSLPIQMDGDVAGFTPVTVEVTPGALRAIVASGANEILFGSGP